jgi:hypothetical protein
MRRATLGPAVPAGGEEWPLHYGHHPAATLASIRSAIERIDVVADSSAPTSAAHR